MNSARDVSKISLAAEYLQVFHMASQNRSFPSRYS